MKGFDCVTDNEWFAFLSQQPLLPKTSRHSAIKTADKNNGGQALQKDGGQALQKDGGQALSRNRYILSEVRI